MKRKIFGVVCLILLSFLANAQHHSYGDKTRGVDTSYTYGKWYYPVQPGAYGSGDTLRIVFFKQLRDTANAIRTSIAAPGLQQVITTSAALTVNNTITLGGNTLAFTGGNIGLGVAASSSSQVKLIDASTSLSQLNLGAGHAGPTSPNTGDIWWDGTQLNFRKSGSTVDLLAASATHGIDDVLAVAQTLTANRSIANGGFLGEFTGAGHWLFNSTTDVAGYVQITHTSVPQLVLLYDATHYVNFQATTAHLGVSFNGISGGLTDWGGTIEPATNNAYDLGGSSNLWIHTYSIMHLDDNQAGGSSGLGTNVTSLTMTGGQSHFQLTLVTSGAVTGTIGHMSFHTAWPHTPVCLVSAADVTTASAVAAGGGYIALNGTSTTDMIMTGSISASGTYTFNCQCGGH